MSIPDNRLRRSTAESSTPGWLGFFFGATDSRRLAIAIAAAIALHEIFAGLLPQLLPHATNEPETVAHVTIAKIEKRKPKPTPTPKPKPAIPPRVIAQVVDPGKSAHVEVVKKSAASRPKVVTKYHSKPIAAVPVGGQGAGAGSKGTVGSLGTGGTGSGSGDQGNGSGGACGDIDFADPSAASYDAATGNYFYDGIEMIVHYSDGHAETTTLDYPWHYHNPAMDPFKHTDAPMLFQFPPKAMRANEPPIVQYVMAHTDEMGGTQLNGCPGSTATASPQP